MTGPILALDLATRAGYAIGRAGEIPRSGCVLLKERGEKRDIAFANLISFIKKKIEREIPDLIVKEAQLALGAFAAVGSSSDNVRLQIGMHAIVEGMASRFGIVVKDVSAGTVRRHFIGQAHMGDRESTKRAVVQRCHLLRLMPADCFDDNRADALAIHDWACATFGRPKLELVIVGDQSA